MQRLRTGITFPAQYLVHLIRIRTIACARKQQQHMDRMTCRNLYIARPPLRIRTELGKLWQRLLRLSNTPSDELHCCQILETVGGHGLLIGVDIKDVPNILNAIV